MEIHRSYYYYESVKDDTEVEEAIRAAAEYGDGFEKIFQRLRHDGYTWNHKKVYRVYKKIHFNKRSRLKKRLPKRVREPLEAPLEPNKTWSMDFVSDKMESGRTFRVLNILDAYIFRNIEEVRELTERWRTDYNERRPHEALGNMTPQEYKEMLLTGEIRSLGHSVPAAEANP